MSLLFQRRWHVHLRPCLNVFAGNQRHQLRSGPPSELAVARGVELSVGLSMELVTLVFFLHSKATWSLHSLWQFIPQSAESVQHVRTGTGDNLDISKQTSTDFSLNTFCSASAALGALHAHCEANKQLSHLLRDGGGGKLWCSAAGWFFFFFHVLQAVCNTEKKKNHNRFLRITLQYLLPMHDRQTFGQI